MAAPMHCDGQDDDLAVYIVTDISQAETMAFCLPDFLGFCLAFVEAVAPDMLAKPPAEQPKQPRQRKPRATAAAPAGNASGPGKD